MTHICQCSDVSSPFDAMDPFCYCLWAHSAYLPAEARLKTNYSPISLKLLKQVPPPFILSCHFKLLIAYVSLL